MSAAGGASNRASRRWSAQRAPGGDHLDHHMPILMSADGPFADSTDQNKPGEPLPSETPPAEMFPDTRQQQRRNSPTFPTTSVWLYETAPAAGSPLVYAVRVNCRILAKYQTTPSASVTSPAIAAT